MPKALAASRAERNARIITMHKDGITAGRIAAAVATPVHVVRGVLAAWAMSPEFVAHNTAADVARTARASLDPAHARRRARALLLHGGPEWTRERVAAATGLSHAVVAQIGDDVLTNGLPKHAPVHGGDCTCEDAVLARVARTHGETRVNVSGAELGALAAGHRAKAIAAAPHPNSARARRLPSTATSPTRRALAIA